MQGLADHGKEYVMGCHRRFWKVLTSKCDFKYMTLSASFQKVFHFSKVKTDKLEAENRKNKHAN